MSNTDLLVRLRELHEELSTINDDLKSSESIDEEMIDALGQLVTDAGVLVDQARESRDRGDDIPARHDLIERIMQFESGHPRVTRFLSQLTDMLVMLGI